jgi:hypothetical protein
VASLVPAIAFRTSPLGSRAIERVVALKEALDAGGIQTVGTYPSLEQCRDALKVAVTNVAANYTCEATPVNGTWSRNGSRYVMLRE